ncbi:MAG: hypothetical protein HQK61_02190 [Desulfamplus sp.]|nr:hypothetical protein [Desulfamplus sp.]
MEIVIGAVSRVGAPMKKMDANDNFIEAKVLNVRRPRRRPAAGKDSGNVERRNNQSTYDPATGRVMVLLVPEGYNIPSDINSDNYRVFLRFASKKR